MVLLVTPGEDVPDDFDDLLYVGLELGGVLVVGGLLLTAFGSLSRRRAP
jgi:hypothetical protein